ASRRRHAHGGCRREWRFGPAPHRADDRYARDAWTASDGAVARHRIGNAKAAGGGHHRGTNFGNAPDAVRPAGGLRPVFEERDAGFPLRRRCSLNAFDPSTLLNFQASQLYRAVYDRPFYSL